MDLSRQFSVFISEPSKRELVRAHAPKKDVAANGWNTSVMPPTFIRAKQASVRSVIKRRKKGEQLRERHIHYLKVT
jgi:hypothetical protein